MPNSNTISIVERNTYLRQGLISLLAQDQYKILNEFEGLSGKALHGISSPKLFIVGVADPNVLMPDVVEKIKTAHPKSRVALLSSSPDYKDIASAFAAGTDGYLMREISPNALKASLRLIMLGEKVFPSCMAQIIRDLKPNTALITNDDIKFTPREQEIMKFLSSGASNKVIANALDITEATVKVHVKTILRRLDVANRTQAAIWAINNGFGQFYHA